MRYQNEAREYVDCVTVCPGPGTSVSTLVLKSDEERTIFRSYLYRDADFPNSKPSVLFEVKTWATSLWVSSSGRHHLTGIHGEVWEEAASGFEATQPTQVTLHGLWGASDNDLVVVGDNGTVLRRTGAGDWNDFSVETNEPIYNVHGLADGFLAVVGRRGGFHLRDGSSWATIELGTTVDLRGVFVVDRKNIYICGDRGLCFLYRDGELVQLTAEPKNYFNVQRYKGAFYFGAGNGGVDVLKDGAIVPFQPKAGAIRLNASEAFLWSCNDNKVFRFDGTGWLVSTFV